MPEDLILAAIQEKRFVSAKRDISARIARFPKKLYYQALNAYYLVAAASAQEAADACHAVRKQNPNDAPTLELLFDAYAGLGLSDEAHLVFENAANKYPSTELLMTWFKRASSSYDYPKMRASSLALSKLSPSSRTYKYYFAFSSLMSGEGLEEALSVLEKTKPFENSDEVCLYAKLLTKTGNLNEVVATLSKTTQKPLELTLMHLSALKETKMWPELLQESTKLLFEEAFNDYNTWKHFVVALHKLGVSFAETAGKIDFSSRNSYVASIFLNSVYGNDLDESVQTYYNEFKAKPCCALDLSNFDIPQSFLTKINEAKTTLLSKAELSAEEVAILLNIERINLFSGAKIEWSDYCKYENPELSDMFLASMIQSMNSGLTTRDTLKYIVRLEAYAKKDPENFYIKLWLLNLYSSLNVPGLALETYADLKIKMIQHDVLAYKLSLNPSPKNVNQLLQIYRFYMTSDAEVSEYLEIAMKKGLYTKLEDLFAFAKRLSNSLLRHLLVANITRMCRLMGNQYYTYFLNLVQGKRAEILSDSFSTSDNRDFETDYKLGFKMDKISLFSQGSKKTTDYVKLLYIKELIITEDTPHHLPGLLKAFDELIADSLVSEALSPSEQHFFRLYGNLFKLSKGLPKDVDSTVEYLQSNATFAFIKANFLEKTSPLSTSANQILTNVSEYVKVTKLILEDTKLLEIANKLQKELVMYVIKNPEVTFFKEVTSGFEIQDVDPDFVTAQMNRIEGATRDAKFKIK